ncbi:hypothetical protein DFS34DRAFT_179678 [Phlyctochytrium arcticum]|nr:hypothetical protein DFS34DRAFT_179678 [Phlyctochytrium arcticum]
MMARTPSLITAVTHRAVAVLLLVTLFTQSCTAFSSAYKVRKLEESSRSNGAIKLNGDDFKLYTEAPRNYSIVIALTATNPELKCVPCQKFEPELNLVAAGWNRIQKDRNLYFGSLEYRDGQEVFQRMGVQSVPLVLYFPPTEGPHAVGSTDMEAYDLNRRGIEAEALAEYIGNRVGTEFKVRRPINYAYYGTMAVLAVGVLMLAQFVWRQFSNVFTSRKIWCTAVIGWTVLMCSGHMWNSIRGPPYTGVRDNRPEIISPGFQSQFVLESQIVGLLYAVTSITFVALVTKTPTIADPGNQRLAVFGLVCLFMVLYSVLLRIFRAKNGAYPFKMLF